MLNAQRPRLVAKLGEGFGGVTQVAPPASHPACANGMCESAVGWRLFVALWQ